MKNFWKKAGWSGMTALPVVASFGLQFAIVFAILFAVYFKMVFQLMSGGSINGLSEAILNPDFLSNPEFSTQLNSVVLLAFHVISIPIFFVWYKYGCRKAKPKRIGEVFKGRCVAVTVIAATGLCLLANVYVLFSEYIFPSAYQHYIEIMESSGLGVSPAAIVAAVIVAPIGEEIMCRGVIFHYAGKLTNGMKNKTAAFWIANIIQAFWFGVLHANFIQGSYAFIIGLVLGILKEKYNSLYPAILGHFAVNFLSSFVMGYIFLALPETLYAYAMAGVVGIVILLLAAWLGKEEKRGETP